MGNNYKEKIKMFFRSTWPGPSKAASNQTCFDPLPDTSILVLLETLVQSNRHYNVVLVFLGPKKTTRTVDNRTGNYVWVKTKPNEATKWEKGE